METSRKRLGDLGEELAGSYLESLGHSILERNWRSSHLEIDIISAAADGIHFVEVKSRVAPLSAVPQANVTAAKQRRLSVAALGYLNTRHLGDAEVFFDIITVVFDGGRADINYCKQAFIPTYL